MNMKFVTKYRVVTVDLEVIVRPGFSSWEEAYHWALMVDDGHFDNHGGLRVASYEVRVK